MKEAPTLHLITCIITDDEDLTMPWLYGNKESKPVNVDSSYHVQKITIENQHFSRFIYVMQKDLTLN